LGREVFIVFGVWLSYLKYTCEITPFLLWLTGENGVAKYFLLGILNIITKSRLSSLNLVTVPKMPNLSLTPLKRSCHPKHDIRDAVLKYAIALLNK